MEDRTKLSLSTDLLSIYVGFNYFARDCFIINEGVLKDRKPTKVCLVIFRNIEKQSKFIITLTAEIEDFEEYVIEILEIIKDTPNIDEITFNSFEKTEFDAISKVYKFMDIS